jgi:hypothetical protein
MNEANEIQREFKTYEDSIITACTSELQEKDSRMTVKGITEVLEQEPYGIYNDEHPEVLSLSNTTNIDTLVQNFHGKTVYFSRKRRCIEQDQVLEDADGSQTAKQTMTSICSNASFNSHILSGPYAKIFSNRCYFELSQDISLLLNKCWIKSPSMKYFSAKAMADAILY